MNPTTLLSSGGIIGLFALAISLVVWLLRIWIAQNRSAVLREEALLQQIAEARTETSQVRAEHQQCERRLNAVVAALTRAGIQVPIEAWGDHA